MLRKFLCVFISLFLLISPLSLSAATPNPAHGTITVGTVEALTGDLVIVPIRIDNNPGIMAITVSVTYDPAALTYEAYNRGYLKDYTVADHPTQKLIRFVNCETKERNDNGDMVYFQFRVNENASAGLHPISIEYKEGDFCNWNLEKLMPVIVPGGVDVAPNGTNCSHKQYTDWEIAAAPGCETPGANQRTCKRCGHIDIAETSPIGHTFEENWTIDTPATKTQPGVMSRHCIRCNASTDPLQFTLEQIEKQSDVENKKNEELPKNEFVETLINHQSSPEDAAATPSEDPAVSEENPDSDPQSDPGESDSQNREMIGKESISRLAAFFEMIPDEDRLFVGTSIALFLLFKIILF